MSSGFLVMKAPLPDSFTASKHKTKKNQKRVVLLKQSMFIIKNQHDSYIYIPKRLLKYLAMP